MFWKPPSDLESVVPQLIIYNIYNTIIALFIHYLLLLDDLLLQCEASLLCGMYCLEFSLCTYISYCLCGFEMRVANCALYVKASFSAWNTVVWIHEYIFNMVIPWHPCFHCVQVWNVWNLGLWNRNTRLNGQLWASIVLSQKTVKSSL